MDEFRASFISANPLSSSPNGNSSCFAGRSVRVLMVEDSPVYLACIQKFLGSRVSPGFDVDNRSTLRDAIEYLNTSMFPPDAILVDLSLPDSSGLNTLSEVIKYAGGIPVIVLSATHEEQLGLEAVRRGAHDYLVKQMVSNESLARCILYAFERRRLEESRMRQEAIRDFTDTLAHDLRIPMIGAEAVLESLFQSLSVSLPEEQSQMLKTLRESNRKQLALVRKLIEVYKYEPDRKLEFTDLQLDRIFPECLSSIQNDRGSKIKLDIAEGLPEIKGDYEAILLLFSNLLDNAVRHGDAGGPISVTAFESGAFVAVEVCNQGKTLPDELKDGGFQQFWRSVPGKRYVAKTGTGLYLCDRIVNLHNGQIKCRSNMQETTFTVTLPKA